MIERWQIKIDGLVQGVGFRPFVHGLATGLGLGGSVSNDVDGVEIEVEGQRETLGRFLVQLGAGAPPSALITSLRQEAIEPRGERSFSVGASRCGEGRSAFISPDLATCDACLRDLFDPTDRRHLYPFINCTHCGPRYTIVRDVPYDRPRTTMAAFAPCDACQSEYEDPRDRRFHAQPIACAKCGPSLALFDARTGAPSEAADPIDETARLLRSGKIVAIKGLGGYHLAAHALDEGAVRALRARKHREEKPFALLVPSIEHARRWVEVDAVAELLLSGRARPIVLLPRRRADTASVSLASSIAPRNHDLGVMLPYTPLHHLLVRALDAPLVLTSGNVSDEPIAYLDDDARGRLSAVADYFLTHDRPIHVRTDDSVFRVFEGRPLPLRRSRGYAPQPIALPISAEHAILACGAELKSTVAAVKNRFAFLSHHLGDLENFEVYRSFTEAIDHLSRLFDVKPQVIAHDLHPEYLSTKWALDQVDVELIAVQHHHAHVAACMADNGVAERVIGVVYDGLGYGTDGTFWGGEILLADLTRFERAGHWSTVAMPGGSAAIREPWRMAAAYLTSIGEAGAERPIKERNAARWDAIAALAQKPGTLRTSSMGRLFDAVAALLGIRDTVTYEGQAAIELQQSAEREESGNYRVSLIRPESSAAETGFVIEAAGVLRGVLDDLDRDVPRAKIAARFHASIADATLTACLAARERSGVNLVALTGGVFQNVLLLEWTKSRLDRAGFRTLLHQQVPPNDGGIALGQAAIAAASKRR